MNNPLIAICSDLHFGQSNFNKEIFEEQMQFFELQFFPYILENKIKHVVCCGDFFHNRNVINWLLFIELKNRFFKWFDDNDVIFHVILGNHDLFYRNTLDVNSLTNSVNEFKNIKVYDIPTKINIGKYIIGMIPWIINHKSYKFPDKCDILFGHLDLYDFPMMKGINSKEGVDCSIFKPYKYVFSGHYHIKYNKDNVYMVGTPYQMTWNDFNEQKGFYILGENYELEYIQNTVNPKYVKLYYDNDIIEVHGLDKLKNITQVESIEIAKNHYTRLFIKKADDQLKLEQYHSSILTISKNNYKIDIINTVDVIDDDEYNYEIEDESTIKTIISHIEGMSFDKSINKQVLIDLSKKLYAEALDESLSIG